MFQGLLLFFVLSCDTLINYQVRLVRRAFFRRQFMRVKVAAKPGVSNLLSVLGACTDTDPEVLADPVVYPTDTSKLEFISDTGDFEISYSDAFIEAKG